MFSVLLYLWGSIIVLVWAMVSLDKIKIFVNIPYSLGITAVSNASMFGFLEVLNGRIPDISTSLIIASIAICIIFDRRRHRRQYSIILENDS
jgi:hypothetical protein